MRTRPIRRTRNALCTASSRDTGHSPQALWQDICTEAIWIDRFDPAWQQHLSSQSVTELGYFKNFFTGINFHTLVPDQNHTLLTGGYGTYNDNNVHSQPG